MVRQEMKKFPKEFNPIVIHPGQHLNLNQSVVFFKALNLPIVYIYLGVGLEDSVIRTTG